jgi:hypothetical protein
MPRTRPSASAVVLRPAAALLCLVAAGAAAQDNREQAAHVHGVTAVTLAVVGGRLELELTAPGMDLVGFEHAPRDAQQTQAIEAATATLERSGDWLAFEPPGSCTVASAEAHSHGFKAEAAADGAGDGGGSHGHDHDHGDHQHGGGHGEFHLTLAGTCSAAPQALRIDLAARFPGIEQIRVDLITDAVQDRVELGAGQTRVPLAR